MRVLARSILSISVISVLLSGATGAVAKPGAPEDGASASRQEPSQRMSESDRGIRSLEDAFDSVAWLCGSDLLAWQPSLSLSDEFYDEGYGAYLVTNEQDFSDCVEDPEDFVVYQQGRAYSASLWNKGYDDEDLYNRFWGDNAIAARGDMSVLEWSGVPMPSPGQYVYGLSQWGGRLVMAGAVVDSLVDTFVTDSGEDFCPYGYGECLFSFWITIDEASQITAGSPILNENGQVLGTATASGSDGEMIWVRGTPSLCLSVINCYDPENVWLDASPPDAPTITEVEPLHQALRVYWAPPLSDGGSEILEYTATASPGGSSCTSSGMSCTIPGLTNGVAYVVTVAAENEAGWGPDSEPVAGVPTLSPPQPVAWVKGSLKGNALRITWMPVYQESSGHSPWEWFEYSINGGAWTRTTQNFARITKPAGVRVFKVSVKAANSAGYSRPKMVTIR